MVQTQESLIIANFVARLKTTSPFSCESLPEGAEYCESDSDIALYERYIKSDRSQKIQQCALDALTVIRDVYNGQAELHWNPGIKPPDVINFKIIYPILRSSIDCLLNQVGNIEKNNKFKTNDPKAHFDDSSTLTFEGLFILIKASLEFIHPSAYSFDGVVLSQLISLLDKVSFSIQLVNANLGCLVVYLCRVYIDGFLDRLPENGELFLRQHSVLFYKVISLSVTGPGKNINPNSLLFLRRIIKTILFILNRAINEPEGEINQKLVFYMSKFIDIWYGSLAKFLVNLRTNNLVFYLTNKKVDNLKCSKKNGNSYTNSSNYDSSSDSESDENDGTTVSEDTSSEQSMTETSIPESRSDRYNTNYFNEHYRKSESFKNDKEQLLIKTCKLIHETPLLPPSHRMRLIAQIGFVFAEANTNELETEALNGLLVLLDFSEDVNSSILKSNLLPLLKELVKLLMSKVEDSVVGLVNVVEKSEVEKFVVLVYCLGQVISNVLKLRYEYDPENVDQFLQDQIKQMNPENYKKTKENQNEENIKEENNMDIDNKDKETEEKEDEDKFENIDAQSDDSVYFDVDSEDQKDNKEEEEEDNTNNQNNNNDNTKNKQEEEDEENNEENENDRVLFEMTNSVMKLFSRLLNMNDDSVDEAVSAVVCWMLREVKFELTFKLAVPIACVFLRTKKSRMLDVICGKNENYTTTAQIAMSSSKRWVLGSNILKTSLEYYLCELAQDPNQYNQNNKDEDNMDTDNRGDNNKNKEKEEENENKDENKKDTKNKEKEENKKENKRENKWSRYKELDIGMRSLFTTVFDCYLDVVAECSGIVQEEVEDCFGLYLTCFGFSDYFKRMPLEKLYLVPITSERYKAESFQYMLPILGRQLKGFKMEVFPRYILPVLNHLEYFVNKTKELKFTAESLNGELDSSPNVYKNTRQKQNQPETSTDSRAEDISRLNRVHQQYEQVYNELLELMVPLSLDKDSIDVLVDQDYLVLKYIVNLLDKSDEQFNTACKVISNFVRLDKVAAELIGILVKKFVSIEYKSDGDSDSHTKSDNILSAISNVALYCSSEMLSRNLESLEKALGGKMNNYLIRLSKSLFPHVSDELKYKMYKKYMKFPKEKFIYSAIRTALETVLKKLENNKELVNKLNNVGLNAYNGPNSLEKFNNMNFPMGVVGIRPLNMSLISLKSGDLNKLGGSRPSKGAEGGLERDMEDKMDLDISDNNNNDQYNQNNNTNNKEEDNMDTDNRGDNNKNKEKEEENENKDEMYNRDSQDIKVENETSMSYSDQQEEEDETDTPTKESCEEELVKMVVRVNGMSELASYLGVLSETIDTCKQRVNCLLTYTKLLVFVRNNLTKVDYSTLVALIMKPLIFECIVNSCVNNKNNRAYSFSIFENVFDFEGNYHNVLKVSLTILYNINDTTRKELLNMCIGTMKLLCYIFSKRFHQFDVGETTRLVVYLSERLNDKSCNFYVHILKFFRVVVVKMDYDRMVKTVPHMMKLFQNEKCCEKGKMYVRRLVEKLLIRLNRDYLFSIFPKKHFPLLTNIILTRKRKYKSMYEGRKSRKVDYNKLDFEEEEDEDLDELDESVTEEDVYFDKYYEEEAKSKPSQSERTGHNKKHDGNIARKKTGEKHKVKKPTETNKDSKYVKLNKKASRKEQVKVLKGIMKNKNK